MMRMETESIVVPRLRVAVEATPGRVTGRLSELFLGLRVALSRGHPVRSTVREAAIVDIEVVGVVAMGGFVGSLRPRLLLTMRLPLLRQITLSLLILLVRRWMW